MSLQPNGVGSSEQCADDLGILDSISQPVWLYSCSTQKLIWANKAALRYFNKSLDGFTSYKFGRLSPEELSSFLVLNTLIRDEVENGGLDQVVSGFGHTVLPGVIPHEDLSSSEFLFKQFHLTRPIANSSRVTQVQLLSGPSLSMPSANTALVKTARRERTRQSSTDGRVVNGTKVTSTVSSLIELCDRILKGQEVDLNSVEAVHQAVLRGDIITQPTRIEEELVSKEELDQDVGLNLLQLLGGKKLGERFAHAQDGYDGDLITGPMPSGSRCGTPAVKEEAEPTGEEERDVVAASLMPAMEAVLATVDDWRFNAFKLAEVTQGHPLSALGFWLMKRYDLIAVFQLDATKLARFLRKIEDGYPDNPYHNKTHAADVLQGMHCLLTRGGLHRRLGEDVAIFASYLAAIAHDYEHKGLNNDFLVRVGDDLAFTYNDISPMENHHIASAFKLMRQKDYNFIKKIPREKWVRLRRLLIDMVLATDMKQHFNILSKFQSKLQVKLRSTNFAAPNLSHLESPSHEDPLPISDDDADKSLVLQVGLKCADVGHLAAPWEVHHRWVSGLEEEFFRQGDKEKSMHMMVSPLMDRCKDGITKSQVGFFDIVALPLFYSWASVFHEALPLVRAVEDNCNRWRSLEMGRNAGPK
ncbi:putative 3',5'-cyclic phosphodiesterase pde-1 [Tetrabaena socialis]|uniref:Phosphodiesterase n=1 Tax=Tetrabaena socialis TaxID=47790 RepID=A0A2J8A5Z5_9CHLO|nr:putative 3',5'-cyclic phosphodiesterase pde-1 [Tetrabaena socialis]|eukprot:PNH07949.1 putative 3',5'-cyclic phosphodiesterase pde-1 [Tetrabaena socialis]